MKRIWKTLVKLHWKAFMYNALYFLLTLPLVALYLLIRLSWYKSKGKNYWGQTPEEEAQELKEAMKENPFFRGWYH